jgi:lipopolysaccharide/colanic/teichoic acid biosynthesis glycosyltransferase
MKTGAEYLHSRQKRAVDIVFSSLAFPLDMGAAAIAEHTFAEPGQLYFFQERTGQDANNLTLKKIRTLDNSGVVLSGLAQMFRNKGIDELPQIAAVRAGHMSVFGSRPLIPNEYDEIRDKASETRAGRSLLAEHDEIVMPAKRGLLSRYGLFCHTAGYENKVEQRLSMDIYDHVNASLEYDFRTLVMCIGAAINNELLHRGKGTNS